MLTSTPTLAMTDTATTGSPTLPLTPDPGFATPTPVLTSGHCKSGDSGGCLETIIYEPDGAPLELLYADNPDGSGALTHYSYEVDGRGNVVALTTSDGSVVDRYSYSLWGVPTILQEGVPQPLFYAGYLYDHELGDAWLIGATWL